MSRENRPCDVGPGKGTRDASSNRDAAPGTGEDVHSDNRKVWDWQSKYPAEARYGINCEASILVAELVIALVLTGLFLGLPDRPVQLQLGWLGSGHASSAGVVEGAAQAPVLNIDFHILAIFFAGVVGGITFSIKWLVHAAASGKWHLDRRYWRLLVPLLGGVYACVVLTLFNSGLIGSGQASDQIRPIAISAALAFLVGYFSDGVSGLLSNVANAVFGTLEKK